MPQFQDKHVTCRVSNDLRFYFIIYIQAGENMSRGLEVA